MSISCIAWAFEQDCRSSGEKLVLLKLADNANDDGVCWPAQATIGRHCGMKRNSVNYHINNLAECSIISIEKRFVEGVRIPNVYRLHVGGVVDTADRGSRHSGQGVVDTADTEPSSTEPSIEPIEARSQANGHALSESVVETVEPKGTDPPAKQKPKRAHRLPDDWHPDMDTIDWAETEFPGINVENETQKFCDHFKANGKPMIDWNAAHRNWLRRSGDFNRAH